MHLLAAGGMLAELAEQTIEELNRVLPKTWSRANPVDIIGDAPAKRYADALAALIRDPGVDAILVLNCPTALGQPEETVHSVIDAVAAGSAALRNRNVITAWLGENSARPARELFAQAHIASYETPDDAVIGFLHRVHHRANQELLIETPPARPDAFEPDLATARHVIATALAAGKSWLASETAAVFAAYGLPLVADHLAGDPDQAALLATAIGFPVALKIRSREITHKSDVGGVALNLGNADRVRQEAGAMIERVKTARPSRAFFSSP